MQKLRYREMQSAQPSLACSHRISEREIPGTAGVKRMMIQMRHLLTAVKTIAVTNLNISRSTDRRDLNLEDNFCDS